MKYFVLGALASGFLLYGMSMIYGATGSLQIDQVIAGAAANRTGNPILLVFGLVFVVSAIAFKLGAVPYHMWVPDVYHGAPTPITLLIGTAPEVRRVRDDAAPARRRARRRRVRLAGRCWWCCRCCR